MVLGNTLRQIILEETIKEGGYKLSVAVCRNFFSGDLNFTLTTTQEEEYHNSLADIDQSFIKVISNRCCKIYHHQKKWP